MNLREAWRWADRRFTVNLLGIVINRKIVKAERINRRIRREMDKQRQTLDRIDKLARWRMEVYDRG